MGTVLNDNDRATKALAKAFEANPRNEIVAVRLARQFEGTGQIQKALDVLRKALDANPSSRRLHYAFATILMKSSAGEGETIAYHLQRGFTDGDNKHEAKLLFGRQLFLNGRIDESRSLFRRLSAVRVAPQIKNRLLYPIEGRTFEGRMTRPQGSFAFITRDGPGDLIYVHRANVPEAIWNELTLGTRVRFRIAFALGGTNAFDLQII